VKATRRDVNERAIIVALEAAGCLVQQLHQGDGVPDLLVAAPTGNGLRLVLLEVKRDTGPPSKRSLTREQVAWHLRWEHAPIFIVESASQALAAVLPSHRTQQPKGSP
jgi:hypothetical protein